MSRRRYAVQAKWAVVTRGEKGCIALYRNDTYQTEGCAWATLVIPAFSLQSQEVVDTTGAGDAFIGGLAASTVRGLDLESSLKVAAWVAAMNCKGQGARGGMPVASDMPTEIAALWGAT